MPHLPPLSAAPTPAAPGQRPPPRGERTKRLGVPRPGALLPGVLLLSALLLGSPAPARADCFADTPVIEAHEQNYLLLYSEDHRVLRERDGRMPQEFIFQFSIRRNLLSCDWVPLYFGYTQRSFWQLYDWDGSAPFRESNYHPELFVDYRLTWLKDTPWGLRLGIEHESNGQRDPLSRSWNRTYGKVSYATEALGWSLRAWDRWNEGVKHPPLDPLGDDNPDLQSYRGSWEAQGIWRMNRFFQFGGLLRVGKADRGHPVSGQVDADYCCIGNGIWVRLELYRGYGDNLIDYNRDVTRFGFGFAVKEQADLRLQVR